VRACVRALLVSEVARGQHLVVQTPAVNWLVGVNRS